MTQELNFFWKTMTHRIEPFLLIWLTEWIPSFQFDSKNWTLFNIWLGELNIFFQKNFFNMTQKIQNFQNVVKSWTLFWYDLKNWFFWNNETNIWSLFEHDSKNWIFHKIPIFEPFFENWLHRIQFLKVI